MTPQAAQDYFQVLIGIGSNLGDRTAHIRSAIAMIASGCGEIAAQAPLYATSPLGPADQIFYNTALVIRTEFTPQRMLSALQHVEISLGRKRDIRWGNRTIDLDIILWQTADQLPVVVALPELLIPHPHTLERDFVLVPACEIAGEWVHPHTQKTLFDALKALPTEGRHVLQMITQRI